VPTIAAAAQGTRNLSPHPAALPILHV